MNWSHASLFLAVFLCATTSLTAEAGPKQQKHRATSSAQYTPSACKVALQSDSRFNADGRAYLQLMKDVQARTYARGVKDQLDAKFLHVRLSKQVKAGIEVTPQQNKGLLDADLRASRAFQQTPEELQQMADANARLAKLDADFSSRYGVTWSNCNCRSKPGAESCLVQLDELRAQAARSPTDLAAN